MALFALIVVLGLSLFNLGAAEPAAPGRGDPSWGAQSSQGRAVLSIRSVRPLIVGGQGFKGSERIRISGAGTKSVTASRGGRFTVRMGQYPCAGFTLVARGSAGSRATLNFSNFSNVHCLD